MTGPGTSPHVVVVGAGPVGLMLAGELSLAGARVVVLEELPEPTTESRASTLHARTMEILDQRGLLTDLGTPPPGGPGHFGGIRLDLSGPSPYSGQWKVPQARTEALLHRWATGLGALVLRGHRLVGLTEKDDGVEAEAETADGARLRIPTGYVVGCDGEQSTVRELAGFGFPGEDASRELLRADVAGITVPDRRFERHPAGLAISSRGPNGVTRVMVHRYGAPATPRTEPPGFAEVAAAWAEVTGDDISGGTPLWLNAFGNTRRQADRYRKGRVLLAGDAAHRQMPVGGQALNLGLQDAVNLGWKLAAQVRGTAAAGLLDSYHDERHPVGKRTLGNIAAQALLLLGGPEVEHLRAVFAELLALPEARAHAAGMISGLDIRYGAEPGAHPLTGARTPPLELTVPTGPSTALALLRQGGGVLLDLADDPEPRRLAGPWTDGRVRVVRADPAPGTPAPPFGTALLRPDGHLAWAGTGPSGLEAALRRWFGAPGGR